MASKTYSFQEMPSFAELPDAFVALSEVETTVPLDKGLLMSHLLDEKVTPSNPLFRHWFHASADAQRTSSVLFMDLDGAKVLLVDWRGQGIESFFHPPCSVTSVLHVGASGRREKKRHIHQLHVCLPVSDSEIRVLQRVSVDFWKWTSQLPLAQKAFISMAEKVNRILSSYMLASSQQSFKS